MSKLIPFGWLPGHWGLKGKTRELARLEYEIDDIFELSVARHNLSLTYGDITQTEYDKKILGLERDSGRITQERYRYEMAELIDDPKEKALEKIEVDLYYSKITKHESEKQKLDIEIEDHNSAKYKLANAAIDLKFNIINKNEYDKLEANINNVPYVKILDGGLKDGSVFMTFDWNDKFVEECLSSGIGDHSMTQEEVVGAWYQRWCIEIALEDGFTELENEVNMRQYKGKQIDVDNGKEAHY